MLRPTHAREVAPYRSWLAVALADANEPEQAAEEARNIIAASGDLSSERTENVPEVREVLTDYFHDTRGSHLITDFLLDDRQRVVTLCNVTLINKDGVLSPRIKLWKKDKSKAAKTAATEADGVRFPRTGRGRTRQPFRHLGLPGRS